MIFNLMMARPSAKTVRWGKKRHFYLFLLLVFSLFFVSYAASPQPLPAQNVFSTAATGEWPMLAGNPERTSWTAEEVGGTLNPEWYKPVEAYIPGRVQIIAANSTLYISTGSGLYALDAATGAEKWIYATEFPLGHSPTIDNNVAYVGGLDRKIHAVNALTGQGLWTFEAGAGFETNPLVAENKVFAGSRDGYFYAIHADGTANEGQLAWKYKTGGPILYSAAYKDGVLFFASNDNYAYALNAATGALVWKSAKLPGAGFYSWWPVVYGNRVIFSGSNSYNTSLSDSLSSQELGELYQAYGTPPGELIGSLGTVSGDWAAGTPTINASRILNYLAAKPWRKSVLVLDRSTGAEAETAPVLWTGTHSGTRYPPVVGADNVLYQQNNYISDTYIAAGHIAGWQPGVSYISVVSNDYGAVDEPHAYVAGGNLIHWNLCCDRQSGYFDVTKPNTVFIDNYNAGYRPPTGSFDKNREDTYAGYNLAQVLPGYNFLYFNPHSTYTKPYASFGGDNNGEPGKNGVYGFHGDTNPPIPYNGRVYMHRSNVIIAFGATSGSPSFLPMANMAAAPDDNMTPLGPDYLEAILEQEVQEIIDAGHLRPGYISHGLFDLRSRSACADNPTEYWHNSSETLYTLSLALPYLSAALQADVLAYLQNEYTNYPPHEYNHMGWSTGAAREAFDVPPDVESVMAGYGPAKENYAFNSNGGFTGEGVWRRNVFAFYALWKYAEVANNAQQLWSDSQATFWEEFNDQPSDTLFLNMPLAHNNFIAGYTGYLELEKLAGQPESTNVKNELDRLMLLRANNFTKDTSYTTMTNEYCRTLNVASNFMFLVPELGQYLRDNALSQVTAAFNEYEYVAPYWSAALFAGGYAENAIVPIYNSHSMFMAKAYILGEPEEELEKYIDVPVFPTGDLYYIQKLVVAIGEQTPDFTISITPSSWAVETGGVANFTVDIQVTGGFTSAVTLNYSNPYPSLDVNLTPSTLANPPDQAALALTDLNSSLASPLIYDLTITASGGGIMKTASVRLLVNGLEFYLPHVMKSN